MTAAYFFAIALPATDMLLCYMQCVASFNRMKLCFTTHGHAVHELVTFKSKSSRHNPISPSKLLISS